MLLQVEGIDVNKLQGGWGTPLTAASENGHTEVVVALAEAGADVNQIREVDGYTLLHLASQRGRAAMVSTLMMCNASLTVKNRQGQLPIDIADNDEIRQLINDEMTARFDHGLKRAVLPPPPPPPAVDSETAAAAAAAAIAEVEHDVGGSAGTVSAHATATSVASEDEESEESSDEEDDGW